MYYNIVPEAEKYFFLIKKNMHCGEGVGIPKPVGDGNEIQFLIRVGYG